MKRGGIDACALHFFFCFVCNHFVRAINAHANPLDEEFDIPHKVNPAAFACKADTVSQTRSANKRQTMRAGICQDASLLFTGTL
jgi:hypothetical protein